MTDIGFEGLAIVGAGYVGLVTGAFLADQGRSVDLVEVDSAKRDLIEAGRSPIYEPGLDEILTRVRTAGRLRVSGNLEAVLSRVRLVMLAVGTPPKEDGSADLGALQQAMLTIAAHAQAGTVAIIKSTVPPGTGVRMQRLMDQAGGRVQVVSSPEFLREGSAFADLTNSTRLVVGGEDQDAIERTVLVLNPGQAPVVRTRNTAAELIKYGSNAFLALKISFINEMAGLCDVVGADVEDVALGMGLDPRIGATALKPGLGYGGSCFPKDVAALQHSAAREGFSFWLLRSATEVNEQQRLRFVRKIQQVVGKPIDQCRIALLGLAFKPGTDDMRQAPSIVVANRLIELGATVSGHDPVARVTAGAVLAGVSIHDDVFEALREADAVAVLTEWPMYQEMDWGIAAQVVRQRIVVDGRNCLTPDRVTAAGFHYHGVGRPSSFAETERVLPGRAQESVVEPQPVSAALVLA